ncbi:MAG: DUF6279 family lipoprotein [Betaproteobacteria bacterium]
MTIPARRPVAAAAGRWLRRSLSAFFCMALVLLGGCSALRLSYNQADWLVYRWLDNYADFDDVQAVRVRDAITAWFAWHRRTQLPDYADLLQQIDADVSAETNAERICSLWSAVAARLERSAMHAVPAIADLAPTLKPAQIESIENRYLKKNAEFIDEFLQVDLARRAGESVRRVIRRAESLYQDLDQFQRERVERWVADSPWNPNIAFDERRRRQQDALQLLRRLAGEPVDKAAAQAQIKGWIKRIERSPREPHRLHADRVMQYNCQLAADIHNSMSPSQRRIASKKLKSWAADLRALSAEAGDSAMR